MGCGKSLLVLGTICWILGTAAFVTSMVTKYWKSGTLLVAPYSYNLFQSCTGSLCTDTSWNPDHVGLHIFIPRILMLIAAAMIAVGTLIGIVGVLCNAKKCSLASEGALILCGAIVICVACGVFTGLTINRRGWFDYSFYLGWVSGGLYLLAGSFICCSAAHSS